MNHALLGGEVEADETFIGGKARFMHKSVKARKITGTGGAGKTAVMGLLERGPGTRKSRVHATVLPNTQRATLHQEVRQHVTPGSELHTDEYSGYRGLDEDYVHQIINHAEAYVRDHVTTNRIENFWALLKRTIKGSYVSVEPVHLRRYLDEQVFRFNAAGRTGRGALCGGGQKRAGGQTAHLSAVDRRGRPRGLSRPSNGELSAGQGPHGCASAAPSGAPSGVGAGWSVSVSPGSQSAGSLRALQYTLWPEGDAASWNGNLPHDAWIRQVCYYPN